MVIASDNVATTLLLLEIGGPDVVNDEMRSSVSPPLVSARTTRWRRVDRSARRVPVTWPRPTPTSTNGDGRELVRQQDLIDSHQAYTTIPMRRSFGLPLALRVYNKTGTGFGNFIDSACLKPTRRPGSSPRWSPARTASPAVPMTTLPWPVGRVGKRLYDAWTGPGSPTRNRSPSDPNHRQAAWGTRSPAVRRFRIWEMPSHARASSARCAWGRGDGRCRRRGRRGPNGAGTA